MKGLPSACCIMSIKALSIYYHNLVSIANILILNTQEPAATADAALKIFLTYI